MPEPCHAFSEERAEEPNNALMSCGYAVPRADPICGATFQFPQASYHSSYTSTPQSYFSPPPIRPMSSIPFPCGPDSTVSGPWLEHEEPESYFDDGEARTRGFGEDIHRLRRRTTDSIKSCFGKHPSQTAPQQAQGSRQQQPGATPAFPVARPHQGGPVQTQQRPGYATYPPYQAPGAPGFGRG